MLQVLWFWYGFLILMGLFRTIDRVAQILSWRFRFGRLVMILTFFCWLIWGSKCSNSQTKSARLHLYWYVVDLSLSSLWLFILLHQTWTVAPGFSIKLRHFQSERIVTLLRKSSWLFCRYQLIKWKIRRYFVKTENDEPVLCLLHSM